MTDQFFHHKNCERCHRPIGAFTMSWFTTEAICMTCHEDEQLIRKELFEYGKDYEGCGYIPKIKKEKIA